MLRKLSKYVFLIGLLAIIALSVAPKGALPISGLSDELIHFAGFAALSLAAGIAFGGSLSFFKLMAGLLLLATGPELAQVFIPSRAVQGSDLLANVAGIAAGSTAVISINTFINKRSRIS